MTTIDLNEKVKEKFIKYKEENGCKTYSDAVNLLLKGSEKQNIEDIQTGLFILNENFEKLRYGMIQKGIIDNITDEQLDDLKEQ